jgi:gliding motility-associated-like protein
MKIQSHITGLLVCLTLIFISNSVNATHNRAGEITLRQISDLTYEIKITTFTYTLSAADRSSLEVQWGDNTTSIAPRVELMNLGNNYRRNVYISQHTFPGPGTYSIVVQDPNRNFGVKNIPNSVNVIFSIKTIITVNPSIGNNSTPILLNPPIDKAGLYQTFIHNPAAFDIDGDSISYNLTVCTADDGKPIDNYTYPDASDSLYVDAVTGDLIWDAPVDTGIYNIAMNIEEWRNGVKIGNIVRDMQVEVFNTTNTPPENDSLVSLCVMAGEKIEYAIISHDADGDNMTHFITGGPFALGDTSASYVTTENIPGKITTLFTWQTSCLHPRNQYYTVVVKTEDNNPQLNLIDIDNLFIKVLAPAPVIKEIIPSSNSVNLIWEKYLCNNILGYNVYRKEGSSTYTHDSCTPGLPPSSGFELIGKTKNLNDTIFQDNNNGNELAQGLEYCYRITAILADGSESFPSGESCATLVPGSPALLNVSVTSYDTEGSIYISWAKPMDLVANGAIGPYEYIIYRANDLWGSNRTEINRFNTSDLDDTVFIDQPLNTIDFPYSYIVELYNNEPGNRFLIGKAETASSFYPEIDIGDNFLRLNFIKNVPWLNTEYTIYRYNNNTGIFDSIGITTENFYIDQGLENEKEYCYYAVSKGTRTANDIQYFNENISHQACGIPGDTVAPCPPNLVVRSSCDSLFNELSWSYSPEQSDCTEDIIQYRIYFTPQIGTPYSVIDSLNDKTQLNYLHYPSEALAGCYFVTAIDSFRNESQPSIKYCIDNCIKYAIPNVFSPNEDGQNDLLQPYENQDVEKIDLKIFNRWGQLIFETTDPQINWDGKQKGSNDLVSPGVYYYICDVYEKRITGIEVSNIVGFVHVYHEKGAKNNVDDQIQF